MTFYKTNESDNISEKIDYLMIDTMRWVESYWKRLDKIEASLLFKANFNPSQPRVPAGSPEGGQWTNAGGREASLVVHSRSKISITHENISETREGGSLSWRNNNPANIRYGNFAKRHGAIGENNGFAVFPDKIAGDNASAALLRTPSYYDLTVDGAIARRSPSNENDTSTVQNLVRNFTGLSGREKIKDLSGDQFSRLLDAIRRTEGWVEGSVTQK